MTCEELESAEWSDIAGRFKNARGLINPAQVYRVAIDGKVVQFTGAEMIETVEASTALMDAMQSGDTAAQYRALQRLGLVPTGENSSISDKATDTAMQLRFAEAVGRLGAQGSGEE